MDNTDTVTKPFSAQFKLNAKLLTMIYICYEYKFPLSFMLSFYELYGDNSIFALKALTCSRKIKLTDSGLMKILDESRILYNQIIKGIPTIIKIEQLTRNNKNNDPIPEYPQIDLTPFSEDYKNFLQYYLLENIQDIYSPIVKLKMSTDDIYKELIG